MGYIPDALRQFVYQRAQACCEYCRLSETDAFFPHEVDHIIAEKHRGATDADNLCLSCLHCNRYKGSDIATIDEDNGELVRLFNPRQDRWSEHFRLNGPTIEPLTPRGRATVFLLNMNTEDELIRRIGLLQLDRYPCMPI